MNRGVEAASLPSPDAGVVEASVIGLGRPTREPKLQPLAAFFWGDLEMH